MVHAELDLGPLQYVRWSFLWWQLSSLFLTILQRVLCFVHVQINSVMSGSIIAYSSVASFGIKYNSWISVPASKLFYSMIWKMRLLQFFAKTIDKMTEICKMKITIIYILKHRFWSGCICFLCVYADFLINHYICFSLLKIMLIVLLLKRSMYSF